MTRFLFKLQVMPPHRYRGLVVFPLELRMTEDEHDYASLDEAFRQGLVRVSDTGVIDRVTMENLSRKRWIFAMAGEVIRGGKQNRMLREDVLLPPSSGPVVVPTYCVEQGRWTGSDRERFGSSRGVSGYALRRKALRGAPQREIWEQVDREQERLGVASRTKDYDDIVSNPALARELSGYRTEFARIGGSRTVGMVVAQRGRIVGADAFGNGRLFSKLRDKLIDSYALDCLKRREGERGGLTPEDARDFMARIYRSRFRRRPSPGAGEKLGFRGNGVAGAGLIHRGAAIHLHVSPERPVRPAPPGLPIRPRP